MRILPVFCLFFSLFFSVVHADEVELATGVIPGDALVIEAESMALSPDSDGWIIREHELGAWYTGRPTQLRYLGGQSAKPACATKSVALQKTGKYVLWVRYLDMVNYRTDNAFCIEGIQKEKSVLNHTFDDGEKSPLRGNPVGIQKWGEGFAQWVWDRAEFEAQEGELLLNLKKLRNEPTHGCGRNIDVMILTQDMNYTPDVTDLFPFYIRIRILEKQPYPVAIHFFGKRTYTPWYSPHVNITKNGLQNGIYAGLDRPEELLSAGQQSPWVNISPLMTYGGGNHINLYAIRQYGQTEPEAYFAVDFSRTPSEAGMIRSVERTGTGDGLFFRIDLTDFSLITEVEGCGKNLARAEAVGNVPGCEPHLFPFLTGMSLTKEHSTNKAVDTEMEALQTIGLTDTYSWPASHYFHNTDAPGCLGQPNHERILAQFQGAASHFLTDHNDFSRVISLNIMDEPGYVFEHILSCAHCRAGFARYLESLGIDNADGKIVLTSDAQNNTLKRSYYYSRRYFNHIMTEMLRAGTVAVKKSAWKDVPTTVNFATETLSGNMTERGLDWYEIFNTDALTFGWSEDWAGWAVTYQANGYLVDALRSACRQKRIPFGFYDVLCGCTSWEIQAKGFMEIGHGCRAISFFNYGPEYGMSSDMNSERPEIYDGIKRLTYAVGAVEDQIGAPTQLADGLAIPAQGDVAMLHSITCDIWNAEKDNAFGRERVALSVLLRHCNISIDVLGEDELLPELKKYRVLCATDSHIRREFVPTIVDWVRHGGILYVSAGALERDEFDQPLGLLEQLGVKRAEFKLEQLPGRPEYEMRTLSELGRISVGTENGVKIVCAKQGEAIETVNFENGKVVLVGLFPGISYFSESKKAMNCDVATVVDFPEAGRVFMSQILRLTGVQPRVTTDNYRVEANILHSPDADLLVLSNWTGKTQKTTIHISDIDARSYRGVEGVCGKLIQSEIDQDGNVSIIVQIEAGEILKLLRK